MSDVRALLTEPTPRAARAVALQLLDVLDAEHVRLEKPKDAEALHDFSSGAAAPTQLAACVST